jgi:hypothetical protein
MSDWSKKHGTTIYNGRLITDLLKRFDINDIKSNLTAGIERERVRPHESIEEMAYRIYNDSSLWWVIAILNDIREPSDWPVDDDDLEEMIIAKYGDRANEIKYWLRNEQKLDEYTRVRFEDENGNNINYYELGDDLGSARFKIIRSRGVPITYREDEIIQNEMRREVDVVSKNNIGQFIEFFKEP